LLSREGGDEIFSSRQSPKKLGGKKWGSTLRMGENILDLQEIKKAQKEGTCKIYRNKEKMATIKRKRSLSQPHRKSEVQKSVHNLDTIKNPK